MEKVFDEGRIGICLNGVGNFSNLLWHNYIFDLAKTEDALVFYHFTNKSNEEIDFIKKNIPDVEVKDLKDLHKSNLSISHFFYADTPDNLVLADGIDENTKTSSLFGGLNKKLFNNSEELMLRDEIPKAAFAKCCAASASFSEYPCSLKFFCNWNNSLVI